MCSVFRNHLPYLPPCVNPESFVPSFRYMPGSQPAIPQSNKIKVSLYDILYVCNISMYVIYMYIYIPAGPSYMIFKRHQTASPLALESCFYHILSGPAASFIDVFVWSLHVFWFECCPPADSSHPSHPPALRLSTRVKCAAGHRRQGAGDTDRPRGHHSHRGCAAGTTTGADWTERCGARSCGETARGDAGRAGVFFWFLRNAENSCFSQLRTESPELFAVHYCPAIQLCCEGKCLMTSYDYIYMLIGYRI